MPICSQRAHPGVHNRRRWLLPLASKEKKSLHRKPHCAREQPARSLLPITIHQQTQNSHPSPRARSRFRPPPPLCLKTSPQRRHPQPHKAHKTQRRLTSSKIFWKRRCVEQSRPLSATAWPCSSPTICTSMCRAPVHSCIRKMGEPTTSLVTCCFVVQFVDPTA